MRSPYQIEAPALLCISGGRTSGFMLRQILDESGGKLPDGVHAVFCNTGKEHEATLQFLKRMSDEWSVPITWLEYQIVNGVVGVRVTDYCGASRRGEPFKALIQQRKYLPNPVARFCTAELKVRTADRYATGHLGFDEYTSVIGIRYDEPRRAARIKGDTKRESVVLPMHSDKHTLAEVLAFWKQQPFDLELPGGDNTFGNCDLCFLKGRAKTEKIMRTNPEAAEWWAEMEEEIGSTWRVDRPTYRQMLTQLTIQGQMFDDAIEDDTMPCQCTD